MENEMTIQRAVDNMNVARSAANLAEAQGRSVSTLNRKWRKFFQAEDVVKALSGAWGR